MQKTDRAICLNPCDTVYGKVYGNVDCNEVNPMFWFSGDPVTKVGWLDKTARDDRKFSSIGPLTLEKDKPIEIILALVVGRGTNNLKLNHSCKRKCSKSNSGISKQLCLDDLFTTSGYSC